jgi:DNA-binding beta-propeller fold protein YncE
MIQDPYPTLSAVAVDTARDEVVATDENLFQILAYGRLANTPPGAAMTEPRWRIAGDRTELEFISGLYLDQPRGDIYTIYGDVPGVMHVFSREQPGNAPPARELRVGMNVRGRGIAVDEEHQEILLVSQHNSAVVAFRKQAAGDDAPIRLLQGDRTRLANPHGIALDSRNDLIFVTNHGQVSTRSTAGIDLNRLKPNIPLPRNLAVLGSGRFLPPSITVHRRTAKGDEPPVRVIEGARTQLNWPAGIVVDERRGEVFVANDIGNSILVFRADAAGNVAPIRALKGPETALASPVGLFLDTKNDELWVANYGNHALTVYSPTAEGNTPPRRMIRTAPLRTEALMIGNPGTMAYDTKREEILVPN